MENQDYEDNHEDEDSQNDEDNQNDEDEQDDEYADGLFNYVIFSQIMKKLSQDETMNIIAILPPSVAFLVKPFVHRLIKINVVKKSW